MAQEELSPQILRIIECVRGDVADACPPMGVLPMSIDRLLLVWFALTAVSVIFMPHRMLRGRSRAEK